MGLLDHLETQLERKSPSNGKPPSNKPWTITTPSATIAAWLCTDTIATPAPLPPATAKFACRYPCSAAANVAAWPAV